MHAEAERRVTGADVAGVRPHGEPLSVQLVGDGELEGPAPALLGMQAVADGQAVVAPVEEGPGRPAHQAVDGVVPRRLGQGQLVALAVTLVLAVRDPVGPWHQQLPAAPVALLLLAEAPQDVPPGRGEAAQPSTDLDDDDLEVTGTDGPLLARGRDGGAHRGKPRTPPRLAGPAPPHRRPA